MICNDLLAALGTEPHARYFPLDTDQTSFRLSYHVASILARTCVNLRGSDALQANTSPHVLLSSRWHALCAAEAGRFFLISRLSSWGNWLVEAVVARHLGTNPSMEPVPSRPAIAPSSDKVRSEQVVTNIAPDQCFCFNI